MKEASYMQMQHCEVCGHRSVAKQGGKACPTTQDHMAGGVCAGCSMHMLMGYQEI